MRVTAVDIVPLSARYLRPKAGADQSSNGPRYCVWLHMESHAGIGDMGGGLPRRLRDPPEIRSIEEPTMSRYVAGCWKLRGVLTLSDGLALPSALPGPDLVIEPGSLVRRPVQANTESDYR